MSPARLLLVDDDPELGLIVGVLARKAGQALSCRPDVESAWAALAESRPDLVLLDLELPGASGLDLLRRVRGDAGLSGLPGAQPIRKASSGLSSRWPGSRTRTMMWWTTRLLSGRATTPRRG